VFVDGVVLLGIDTCLSVLCQCIGNFNCLAGYCVVLRVMVTGCSDSDKLAEFAPLAWKFGDDIMVFRIGVHGSMSSPSSCFIGRGSFNCFHKCSLLVVLMPPI